MPENQTAPASAVVYQFPLCCRRRMIYQPARLRWYCKSCGKLMPRGALYVAPPVAPAYINDVWAGLPPGSWV